MTQAVATAAQQGVTQPNSPHGARLVLRRFLRNEPAVVALILLMRAVSWLLCAAAVLPYSYTDLDFSALQEPPSAEHLFGTNSLGQDLLAQTLRGMQKSMLIGVCVAFISATIAATVGTIAGYFGGWRDTVLMFIVDLLLVVPSFILIAIITPRTKQSGTIILADSAAGGLRLDDQLPHGTRSDDEPARARIRPGGKVYGGARTGTSSCATSCRTSRRS